MSEVVKINLSLIDFNDNTGYASYFNGDRLEEAKAELQDPNCKKKLLRCYWKGGKLVLYGNRYYAHAGKALGLTEMEGTIQTPYE